MKFPAGALGLAAGIGIAAVSVTAGSPFAHEAACGHSTLANGMTIATSMKPDWEHVRIDMWIRVGSAQEGAYSGSGINHFIEHALFNGAHPLVIDGEEIRPGHEYEGIARQIHALGGTERAASGEDFTVASITVLADDIKAGIGAMEALVLRAEIREDSHTVPGSELDVVLEEVRASTTSDQRRRYDLQNELMWGGRGYGARGLGQDQLIRQLSVDDLRAFYNAHYVSNNMTLVVIGPVRHEDVRRIARDVFVGPDPARPYHPSRPSPPRLSIPAPLPTLGIERITSRDDAGNAILDFSHRVILARGTVDRALAGVLAELVKARMEEASSSPVEVKAYFDLSQYGGVFTIRVVAPTEKRARKVGSAALEIIGHLRTWATPQDFKEARLRTLRGLERSWDHPGSIARMLGGTERAGAGLQEYRALYESVQDASLDDVARFVRKIVDPANRVVVGHVPGTVAAPAATIEASVVHRHHLQNGSPLVVSRGGATDRLALALSFPLAPFEMPADPAVLRRAVAGSVLGVDVQSTIREDSLTILLDSADGRLAPLLNAAACLFEQMSNGEQAIRAGRADASWTSDADHAVLATLLELGPSIRSASMDELAARPFATAVCGNVPADAVNRISRVIGSRPRAEDPLLRRTTPAAPTPSLQQPRAVASSDGTTRYAVYLRAPAPGHPDRGAFRALAFHLDYRVEESIRALGLARYAGVGWRSRPEAIVVGAAAYRPGQLDRIAQVVDRELSNLTAYGLTESEIDAYRRSRDLRRSVASDTFEQRTMLLAASALDRGAEGPLDIEHVRRAAQRWLCRNARIIVTSVPERAIQRP